ncbi:hypothetical protein BGZ83_005310 [Gryganskiella cystojenkinii]|nr:hypothetical protein BGZ83_005310 [Gryganskiella cystojenkinii]
MTSTLANQSSDNTSTTALPVVGGSGRKTPKVMIVGAGVGGLFLAILLDRAGIPYEIYERAPEVRALGSVMALNANILPVFEQLGIYEEFKKISLPCKSLELMYGSMQKIASVGTIDEKHIGYEYQLFTRPDLYALLQSHIPEEKIHFNKKVMTISQDEDEVLIRCSDGSQYHGDILVGADGAYSNIRQHLYMVLKEKGLLPRSDTEELSKGYTCLVGTTDPVDPEKYPFVKKEHTNQLQVIVEGSPYSFTIFNIPGNRICYVAVCQLTTMGETESEKFRNSEWSSERTAEIISVVKDFEAPCGGTLGDLINLTPPDKVSRVFLEDKLFETWAHGRTVLIGDAAHKLLPSAGSGAVCAMQDAVVLANCLYDLESLKPWAISKAFQDYKEQRYSHVKDQYENSKNNAVFLHGQTPFEKIMRYIVFNWLPDSVKNRQVFKDAMYRPQCTFLEPAPQRGTGTILPQKPSKRYQEEKKQKHQQALAQSVVV